MRRLEHLVPPPLVALIVACGMWGGARLGGPVNAPAGWPFAVALALGAAGLAVAVSGFLAFRRGREHRSAPHRQGRGAGDGRAL